MFNAVSWKQCNLESKSSRSLQLGTNIYVNADSNLHI